MAGLPAADRDRPPRPRRRGQERPLPRGQDQHGRPGGQVGLPLLRGRLRPERLRQGRQGHPDRGRSRLARLPRPPLPEGRRHPPAGDRLARASTRCSTAARTAPSGRTSARHGDGHDRRPGHRDPRATLAVGAPTAGRARRTLGIASLGGATLDNEENYLIKKLFTALGVDPDREPGPDLTLLHRPRSGDLVRPRRRHHASSRTCRTPTASSSRARTWPSATRSASSG